VAVLAHIGIVYDTTLGATGRGYFFAEVIPQGMAGFEESGIGSDSDAGIESGRGGLERGIGRRQLVELFNDLAHGRI
jgi:hypothetical protein